MKMFKIGITLFAFAFLLCGLANLNLVRAAEGDNPAPPPVAGAEYETYTFEKGNVQVPYPKGWKVEDQSDANSLSLLFTPPDKTNGPAEISLQIAPAKGQTQDQVAQFIKDKLKAGYPDIVFKDDRKVKVGDVDAVLMEGTYTEDDVKKRSRAMMAVIDNVVYTMVYSNSDENFSAFSKQHKYMCDNMGIAGKPNFGGAEITIGELEKTEIKAYGVAMNIPKGWTAAPQETYWMAYSDVGPQGVRASVQFTMADAGGKDLDAILKDAQKSLADSIKGYKEISSDKTITAGDLKGKLLVYDQATENDVTARTEVAIFLKGKYVYYVFCGYTEDHYNKLQPKFDEILASFKVTGLPAGAEDNGGDKPDNNGGDDWDSDGGSGSGGHDGESKPPEDKKPPADTGDEWGDDSGSSGSGTEGNTTKPDKEKPPADNGDEWGNDNGGNNGGNNYADLPVKIGDLARREFKNYGMALKVPNEWTDAPFGTLLTISSAEDDSQKIAQVILSNDAANSRSLDKVVKDGKAYFQQNVAGFSLVSEDAFKAGGVNGKLIIYDQDSPRGKYRVAVAIFLKDDTVYDVYCAYSVRDFDKMKPLFMEILNSFEVLKKDAGADGGAGGDEDWGGDE